MGTPLPKSEGIPRDGTRSTAATPSRHGVVGQHAQGGNGELTCKSATRTSTRRLRPTLPPFPALHRRCGTRPKRLAQRRTPAQPKMKTPLSCREILQNKGVSELNRYPRQESNPSECHGGNECFSESGADSGAVGARDDGLERLAELWPMLVPDDRSALLAHAEHLALCVEIPCERRRGVGLMEAEAELSQRRMRQSWSQSTTAPSGASRFTLPRPNRLPSSVVGSVRDGRNMSNTVRHSCCFGCRC